MQVFQLRRLAAWSSPAAGDLSHARVILLSTAVSDALPMERWMAVLNSSSWRSLMPANFNPVRILGSGSFGTVVLATFGGNLYAVKEIPREPVMPARKPGESQRAYYKRYYQRRLEHQQWLVAERAACERVRPFPYFVTMHYAFQSNSAAFLVFEYMPRGDLFDLKAQLAMAGGSLPEATVRVWAAELVVALDHLRQCGVVHRDIKLENIMVDADGHLRLTDFGFAHVGQGRDVALTQPCGTLHYGESPLRSALRFRTIDATAYSPPLRSCAGAADEPPALRLARGLVVAGRGALRTAPPAAAL